MRIFAYAAGAALLLVSGPVVAKPHEGHGKHGYYAESHGKHARAYRYAYGRGGCPPGLSRKNELCMPPGQYKKLYARGQRYPRDYGSRWSYNQIPYELRQRYDLNRSDRYYYGDGYLYQVDPRTSLIERVVHAILR